MGQISPFLQDRHVTVNTVLLNSLWYRTDHDIAKQTLDSCTVLSTSAEAYVIEHHITAFSRILHIICQIYLHTTCPYVPIRTSDCPSKSISAAKQHRVLSYASLSGRITRLAKPCSVTFLATYNNSK